MGVMTQIERAAELDKVADVTGNIQEFVRKHQSESDGQVVAQNLSALLDRVAGSSLREIEYVIAELQLLREKLRDESARVQRDLAGYAALAQSALQSTKVISESLRNRFPR